jgi:hypothetical protein
MQCTTINEDIACRSNPTSFSSTALSVKTRALIKDARYRQKVDVTEIKKKVVEKLLTIELILQNLKSTTGTGQISLRFQVRRVSSSLIIF